MQAQGQDLFNFTPALTLHSGFLLIMNVSNLCGQKSLYGGMCCHTRPGVHLATCFSILSFAKQRRDLLVNLGISQVPG